MRLKWRRIMGDHWLRREGLTILLGPFKEKDPI